MVTSATSLGRSGLYDWLIQRATAVVIGVYLIVVLGYLMMNPGIEYDAWKGFMGSLCMQVANTLVLLCVAAHAWVGLWTVTTDYLTRLSFGAYGTAVRLVAQSGLALITLVYILWGLAIIWGGA